MMDIKKMMGKTDSVQQLLLYHDYCMLLCLYLIFDSSCTIAMLYIDYASNK